jgi:hypothetical protein
MSRTAEQFNKAWNEAVWLVRFHEKPFWIIPTKDGYGVSCFNEDDNLPEGTRTLKVDLKDVK